MKPDRSVKRHTAVYHVSFADEQWEELPALTRMHLCAAEMEEYVQEWNVQQQLVARNRVKGFDLLALASFITIEVEHVEN